MSASLPMGPFQTERDARTAAHRLIPPTPPSSILSRGQNRQLLEDACTEAGLELDAYDARILDWLAGFEDSICAVVAGLVTRAAAKEKVMAERWKPGDRVKLLLPDHTRKVGRGYSDAWFTGTVREVDPPGLLPGVQVDLDQPVSGVSDCYATHGELVPLEASDA